MGGTLEDGAPEVSEVRSNPSSLDSSISWLRLVRGAQSSTERAPDVVDQWMGASELWVTERGGSFQAAGQAHEAVQAQPGEVVTETVTPLTNPSSFLAKLLKPQWDLGQTQRTQFRGGWVVLPRRLSDPGLAAAAEQVEWPVLPGACEPQSETPPNQISFARAVMAGRGDWRGVGGPGFGGGQSNWNQGAGPPGGWIWQGPPQQNPTPTGGFCGGGQYAQADPRAAAPGDFAQAEYYGYGGNYQRPQVNNGMVPNAQNSSNFSGPAGMNQMRPTGVFDQSFRGPRPVGNMGNFGARPTNAKAAGALASSAVGSSSAGMTGIGAKQVQGLCYRCGEAGHGIKECKNNIMCDVCGKVSHITGNCTLPNQPKPVAALVGCGGEGLQMFSALTGRKAEPDKAKQAIALVAVHSGEVNVQQLVEAFSKMFQWGWEWKAIPYRANSYLVKFPSIQKIEELKNYDYFGLSGLNSAVKVSKWDNAAMAKYKLYVVWVRISGVPETLQHYHGFCEAASLIGKVKEIDMKTFRQTGMVRAKVGVKDPRKIPQVAPLNDDDYIYDIWFEIEDIIEQGGPMRGGALIVNPAPDVSMGTDASVTAASGSGMGTNTNRNAGVGLQGHMTASEGQNQSGVVAEAAAHDIVSNSQEGTNVGTGMLQIENGIVDLSQTVSQVPDVDEVVSSQYELDKQLQEEREARKRAEIARLARVEEQNNK